MALKNLVVILIIGYLSSASFSFGASCCGGGSALPALITGDYRAQVNLSLNHSAVIYAADENQVIKKREGNNQEVNESYQLQGSYQFGDYWQAGLALPILRNTKRSTSATESSTGLGDVKFQMAYEFLPELSYSVWKPRGYLYFSQTVPMSKSTYEASKPLRTDSISSGFYRTAIGTALVKNVSVYDLLFRLELSDGFKQKFDVEGQALQISPGLGHKILIGAGVSPKQGNLRLGVTLMASEEEAAQVLGSLSSQGVSRKYWEVGVSVSYLYDNLSLSASFADHNH